MKIEVQRIKIVPPKFGEVQPKNVFKWNEEFFMKLAEDQFYRSNGRNAVSLKDARRWSFQGDEIVEVYEATLILK